MSDRTNGTTPRLPIRYAPIRATATPPPGPNAAAGTAAEAMRFFLRRGVPVEAKADGPGIRITCQGDPSRHPLFRDVLRAWASHSGCAVGVVDQAEAGPVHDGGGFRGAWQREAAFLSLCRRTGCQPAVCGGAAPVEGWAQACSGSDAHLAELQEAFLALRRTGRVSQFERHGITLARQATCAPYGLPAVLLRMKGTCRQFAEGFGMRLLEANPRIPTLLELSPGIVLIENTPPVDHAWDERRFWSAWRGLPPEAWALVDAWAAVRVLRRVETRTGVWSFFDHAYQPRHEVSCLDGLPAPPPVPSTQGSRQLREWRARRRAEVAQARLLDGSSEAGLRRHVYGRMATPYPFIEPLGDAAGEAEAVEEWLAKAATVLHTGLIAEESDADGPAEAQDRRTLAARAWEGLRRMERELERTEGVMIVDPRPQPRPSPERRPACPAPAAPRDPLPVWAGAGI